MQFATKLESTFHKIINAVNLCFKILIMSCTYISHTHSNNFQNVSKFCITSNHAYYNIPFPPPIFTFSSFSFLTSDQTNPVYLMELITPVKLTVKSLLDLFAIFILQVTGFPTRRSSSFVLNSIKK